MQTHKTLRNSNVEFLRILAMMMIIALHYLNASMGGALNESNIPQGTLNYYLSNILETICIISVNIFVLITGYYSIRVSKNGNYSTGIKKSVNLYAIMLFYGLIFFGIALIIKVQNFSYANIMKPIFPFLYGKRWFVETYIMLMLISPFLNKLLCSLQKKNYIVLLIIWISLFSVWPSFLNNPPIKDGGYGIIHFITLYMISGFLKLHISLNKTIKNRLFLILSTTACMICTYFLRNWLPGWNYDFVLNITSAVFVFIFFLIMKPRQNRFINLMASTTFGIYLIHTDVSLIHFIYQDLFHCNRFYQNPLFIVHFVATVVLMFIAGSIIDIMRQCFWKFTFGKWLDKIRFKINA